MAPQKTILYLFLAVIEAVGYSPFMDIVSPSNELGGWPMVQTNWDETKFDLAQAIGLAR